MTKFIACAMQGVEAVIVSGLIGKQSRFGLAMRSVTLLKVEVGLGLYRRLLVLLPLPRRLEPFRGRWTSLQVRVDTLQIEQKWMPSLGQDRAGRGLAEFVSHHQYRVLAVHFDRWPNVDG
jgi:hypothetical protein